MERKIGEIFEFGGEWYQCIKSSDCRECAFNKESGKACFPCEELAREDGEEVIFKKLEKVGEPYRYQGIGIIMVQEYILANINYIWEYGQDIVVIDCQNGKVAIEIKQNKEDMEEYKMYDAKEDIPEFDNVVDECLFGGDKPNLKPFDIQKAREGKPVCTRDGRKARIICFDRMGVYPIVALVQKGGIEMCHFYTTDGKCVEESNYDLMMVSEKKEGWVNIYRSQIYNSLEKAKEAYKRTNNDNNYLQTIRVEWEE